MTCKPSKKKRNETLKFSDEIGPEKPGGNKRKSIKKRLKKAPVRTVGSSVYHMPVNIKFLLFHQIHFAILCFNI